MREFLLILLGYRMGRVASLAQRRECLPPTPFTSGFACLFRTGIGDYCLSVPFVPLVYFYKQKSQPGETEL